MVRPAPSGFERTVVCAIWRTLDATSSGTAVLESTIPANVYACLNVLHLGEVRLDSARSAPLPSIFLTGPLTAPLRTYTTAPLTSLSLVLQPWVLPAWFDIEAPALANSFVSGTQVNALNEPSFVDALRDAVNNPDRLSAVLQMLASRGAAVDEQAAALADALVESRSIAAAAEQLGVGIRQLERRCKRAFGLAPRQWLQVKRFENSLRHLALDDAPLVDVSAEAGYADQSHMTKIYRRAAGHTPGQTKDAIDGDAPGYWAFKPAKMPLQ